MTARRWPGPAGQTPGSSDDPHGGGHTRRGSHLLRDSRIQRPGALAYDQVADRTFFVIYEGRRAKRAGLQDRTAVITSSIDARPRQPKSAFTARVIGEGYFYLGNELAPASNRNCVDSFTHVLQSVCRFLTVLITGTCIKRTL